MRRAPAFAAAALALLGARAAHAFCQSATCPAGASGSTAGQVCTPSMAGDCGVVLQWRQPCVSFAVQQDASRQVDFTTADETLTKAMAAWTGSATASDGMTFTSSIDCGGMPPSLQVFDFGSVSCDKAEYNQHDGNANILVFRDDAWPHDTGGGGVDTLALTTVTYDVDKGDIYDADIEVNTASNTFTTNDMPGPSDVDLLSVLTHETGHFLGLAHSTVIGATMFPSYAPGTISIRTPQPDDIAAICAAYPIDRSPTGDCSGIPRHGFAPECASDQTYVNCSVPSPRPREAPGPGGPLVVLALALAGATARRARRRS